MLVGTQPFGALELERQEADAGEEEHSALKTAFHHFARYGKGSEGAEHMNGSNFRKVITRDKAAHAAAWPLMFSS